MNIKKYDNQDLYKALLQPGDVVHFSWNRPEAPVHTGVFKGYMENGDSFLSEDGKKIPCQAPLVENIDGTDVSLYLPYDAQYYRQEGDPVLETIIRERAAQVNPKAASFLKAALDLPGSDVSLACDADAVLADIYEGVEFYMTGQTKEILGIWEKATDKRSVEDMFEALLGVSFTEWLVRCEQAVLNAGKALN